MERAAISQSDSPSRRVEFQFNPETVTFTKTADWREAASQSAESGPIREYAGAGPLELSLKLLLDDTIPGGSSVSDRVNQLTRWTNPEEEAREQNPEPPVLAFEWGRFRIGSNRQFACRMTKVVVEYTLFSSAGVPLRANCTVTLKENSHFSQGQNPTSGGREPARSAIVAGHETLPGLAQRHYGRTRGWREVAEFNGFDNPFRLQPGSEVVLPAARRRSKHA